MALLLLSYPQTVFLAVQFLVISFQSLSSQFRPAKSLFAHCSLRLGSGAVDFGVELWRYCVALSNCKASTQQLPPSKPSLQHLKQVHKAVAGLLNSVHKPCKGVRCCSGIWRILAIAWSGFIFIFFHPQWSDTQQRNVTDLPSVILTLQGNLCKPLEPQVKPGKSQPSAGRCVIKTRELQGCLGTGWVQLKQNDLFCHLPGMFFFVFF